MKVRVGFVFEFIEHGWLGGFSYFRNLLEALRMLPEPRIEPVILTGRRVPAELLADFPAAECVRSPLLDNGDLRCIVRKLISLFFARDIFLERLLITRRIDVLSHSGYLGPRASIPAVGWIPDFQYRHLPEFFTPLQRAIRDIKYRRACKFCSCVILSSQAVQEDLSRFMPGCRAKTRIIRFVPSLQAGPDIAGREELEKRYAFTGAYFLVPNQFWAHKNHSAIIEALALLKGEGKKTLVLATGSTEDERNPGYFANIMKRLRQYGIEENFRVLGIVPYPHLVSLMRNAVAVINPSLFEGWSTPVEEAKALGKSTILSDIPVHREQNPERGIFFPPHDPPFLAEAMWHLWQSHDARQDESMLRRQEPVTQERIREFAEAYEETVLEVYADRRFVMRKKT